MEITLFAKHSFDIALLAEERDGYVPDYPEGCPGWLTSLMFSRSV